MITPLAVQFGFIIDGPGTFDEDSVATVALGVGLHAAVLAVLHALLRAAGVTHPLGTLLAGGAVTLALGLSYLALLSLSTFNGGSSPHCGPSSPSDSSSSPPARANHHEKLGMSQASKAGPRARTALAVVATGRS